MAERKIRFITAAVAILFLFLTASFSRIQLFQFSAWRAQAEQKRNKTRLARPRRGNILDRNGVILAQDVTRFDVDIIPAEAEGAPGGMPAVLGRLAAISGQPTANLSSRLSEIDGEIDALFRREIGWFANRKLLAEAGSRRRATQEASTRRLLRGRPYPLLPAASPQVRDRVYQADVPGLVITPRPQRIYPNGSLAAHLLGYLGELDDEEYRRREIERSYRDALQPVLGEENFNRLARGLTFRSAHFGTAGIEKRYDHLLRGRWGVKVQQATATGGETLWDLEPGNGTDLHLTIDVRLQKKAEECLAGHVGAIVAIDPRNGEILAMASSPTFDPNDRSTLANTANFPILNRCIAGTYHPGSSIKAVDAIAALEEIPQFALRSYTCSGTHPVGNTFKDCLSSHGTLTVTEALQKSCNIFFYQAGLELGYRPKSRLYEWFCDFGMKDPTGIDLPGEEVGTLLPPQYLGNVADYAIGQVFTVTPLRMAANYCVIANGGRIVKPHLLREESSAVREIPLTPATLATVREGLRKVVNEPGGTAYGAFSGAKLPAGVTVAGKTGSAQTPGSDLTDAWFIAFAPLDDPTICVAVIVERAGHGATHAAPPARKIFETYFGS